MLSDSACPQMRVCLVLRFVTTPPSPNALLNDVFTDAESGGIVSSLHLSLLLLMLNLCKPTFLQAEKRNEIFHDIKIPTK